MQEIDQISNLGRRGGSWLPNIELQININMPMNSFVRRVGTFLLQLGVDPRRLYASFRFIPSYLLGILQLRNSLNQSNKAPFSLHWLPILSDRYMASGVAQGHYFHQDLWAARHVYAQHPRRHVDIGSRIDGFVAHLLVFREVEVLDVRELKSAVSGLHFRQADLMLAGSVDTSTTDSLSCLHALEHFGLGRYGDPINADGWYTGLQNLAYMLCNAGRLYLSVPVGPQVIEYNAQRIFAPGTIVDAAHTLGLALVEFSYVDDTGVFHEKCHIDEASACQFGCGCYVFERVS